MVIQVLMRTLLYVQEVVKHSISNFLNKILLASYFLLYKMCHFFLDTQ